MSKDAVTVASFFTTTTVLWMLGPDINSSMVEWMTYWFTMIAGGNPDAVTETAPQIMMFTINTMISAVLPAMLATCFVSVGLTLYQTKGLFAWESMKPKFSKLNPLEGIKKLFSLNSLIDALKNIIKISILLYIIYNYCRKVMFTFGAFYYVDPAIAASQLFSDAYMMVMQIAMAFLVIAGFDFIYQHWSFEKKLRMSKEEIKQEYKNMEGDPKVKAKIKATQRRMAQSRMMQNLGQADVVVRNPTHFAVALRFKPGQDAAPVVVAKGQDHVAMRIVELAEGYNIPIVEDVPTARALFAMCELNQPIPPQLFEVVAKIMTYFFDINGKKIR